jgi:hypothetical protein
MRPVAPVQVTVGDVRMYVETGFVMRMRHAIRVVVTAVNANLTALLQMEYGMDRTVYVWRGPLWMGRNVALLSPATVLGHLMVLPGTAPPVYVLRSISTGAMENANIICGVGTGNAITGKHAIPAQRTVQVCVIHLRLHVVTQFAVRSLESRV